MAFGDGPDDEALRRAWGDFCDQLRAAGDEVFKDANPTSPLLRADGFRHLTQNLGQAFDLALETRDPRHPVIHPFCTPLRKLGGDAADLYYQQAWIDGSSTYRISGTRGTCRFFNVTVHGPRPATDPSGAPSLHEPFGDVPEANVFGTAIEAEPDGTFELFVGGPSRPGNWLPTTPGSRKLFIRQGFDRWDEEPWRLRIERVDMAEPRPVPDPAELVEAMDWAGGFVAGLMGQWPDHRYAHGGGMFDADAVNAFPGMESADAADAKRGRAVAMMIWRLEPDEALIVEFDAIDEFWMASLGGVFVNSFDYLYRPVSYTPSRASVDGDGRVRLVMAHSDPGLHNWLDTQGFDQGILAFRTMMASTGPVIATRTVPLAELAEVLPVDSVRVTPDERVALMWERFRAVQRQRLAV
jgi:hypothetical protein